ncbi:hypothetical protein U0C82_02625 [Fulvimarina sp. 2208YS6-2-32]|uniref:Uncharacterized protein n=1 Tax=Fulvimarina uroteuthidis TaxID=3098149 RepID=A0ABU5HY34_9HYPH|nr:hypothetical protein [Fulvimarina sp. 2208YS6-2-32]MDY8108044.1 hypothetical protein [Fulvimarina sp. 2208YS6-2-32]
MHTFTITVQIDTNGYLDVDFSHLDGGTEAARRFAYRLGLGTRYLLLKDEQMVLNAADRYEWIKRDAFDLTPLQLSAGETATLKAAIKEAAQATISTIVRNEEPIVDDYPNASFDRCDFIKSLEDESDLDSATSAETFH